MVMKIGCGGATHRRIRSRLAWPRAVAPQALDHRFTAARSRHRVARGQPDHAAVQIKERVVIKTRENIFPRLDAEKTTERGVTVDEEAVTGKVQFIVSRDLAREVIKKLKQGERPKFDPVLCNAVLGGQRAAQRPGGAAIGCDGNACSSLTGTSRDPAQEQDDSHQ